MAKLTIMFKDKVLQEIDIQKSILIGREVGDIMIKNPAVSARHMRLEKAGDRFVIHDLNSTNGTLVNDKPVTSQELRSGDVITVGRHKIRFENPDEGAEAPSFEEDMGGRTIVMDSSQLQSMMADKGQNLDDTRLEEPRHERGPAKLFLSQSSGAPKVMTLEKDVTVIGSSDKSDIRIKGITIGRVAAEISRDNGGYEIIYKGGMAKLKVGGKPVEKHSLSNGDKFSIGSYNFEFRTEL